MPVTRVRGRGGLRASLKAPLTGLGIAKEQGYTFPLFSRRRNRGAHEPTVLNTAKRKSAGAGPSLV